MADHNTQGAPPRSVQVEEKKGTNWLAWLLLLAGIIALIVFLARRGSDEAPATGTVVENSAAAGTTTTQ